MAFTYSKLAEVTVGSGGAATIDFNNIPQNYTDLCILTSVRTNRASNVYGNMKLTFNLSTSNITGRFLRGIDSTTVGSFTTTAAEWGAPASSATASTFGNAMIYIPNYSGSTSKSISIDSVIEDNTSNQFSYLSVGLWTNTSPIVSLGIYTSDASSILVQHSTATLYGVKAEV